MIAGKYRFHGHGSLRYVYANGKAQRSHYVTIKFTKNDRRKNSRFSVVVSKKVLKSAVGRNRIRRSIYEYVRVNMDRLDGVYDIVIICTSSELRDMSYEDFSANIEQVFTKTGIFLPNNT